MSQLVWMGNSGCLLPTLIIFNLFFGRLIFGSPRLWLGVELILILLFILQINILAMRLRRQWLQGQGPQGHGRSSDQRNHRQNGQIIDVEGKVVEEKKKLE